MCGTLRLASTVGFLLLAFSSSVLATWTSPAAKVEQVYLFANGSYWMQLDPQVSVSNPNNCSNHNNWFYMPYALRASDDGKMLVAHIELALAAGKEVEVYTTQCNGGGTYNELEGFRVRE